GRAARPVARWRARLAGTDYPRPSTIAHRPRRKRQLNVRLPVSAPFERRYGVTIPYPSTAAMAVTPPSGAARPRLSFLGTGYLGATYSICFAELGYEVLGMDVHAAKIERLTAGEVPFHEPGLD